MADLENLVKTTLSEMREMTRAQSVVGDPVEVGETTVVP
ncbi:MAG: sporulation protein, partial [Gemmatimonadetes bacterium]|nr:sporulation protein [Gemmatimonadota bacterium]